MGKSLRHRNKLFLTDFPLLKVIHLLHLLLCIKSKEFMLLITLLYYLRNPTDLLRDAQPAKLQKLNPLYWNNNLNLLCRHVKA